MDNGWLGIGWSQARERKSLVVTAGRHTTRSSRHDADPHTGCSVTADGAQIPAARCGKEAARVPFISGLVPAAATSRRLRSAITIDGYGPEVPQHRSPACVLAGPRHDSVC